MQRKSLENILDGANLFLTRYKKLIDPNNNSYFAHYLEKLTIYSFLDRYSKPKDMEFNKVLINSLEPSYMSEVYNAIIRNISDFPKDAFNFMNGYEKLCFVVGYSDMKKAIAENPKLETLYKNKDPMIILLRSVVLGSEKLWFKSKYRIESNALSKKLKKYVIQTVKDHFLKKDKDDVYESFVLGVKKYTPKYNIHKEVSTKLHQTRQIKRLPRNYGRIPINQQRLF